MIAGKRLLMILMIGAVSMLFTVQAATYTIAVNANTKTGSWDRFYERGVASDHMHTVLSTAYGRGIKHAMKLAHDSCGFEYIRGHGVLDDDDAVYSEDASGNAVYTWNGIDGVYDSIIAAGMRPLVEISFMPNKLASAQSWTNSVWYNGYPGNWNAPKDWGKWKAFMGAFLTHLEGRYGAAEVRNNWFFELWNEPNWMYGGGGKDAGYETLYDSTVVAFAAVDPQVRIGGPAEGGGTGGSVVFDPQFATHCKNANKKLDFITYHEYANNGSGVCIATVSSTYHKSIVDGLKKVNFTGLILCDEMGPTFTQGTTCIDNEQSASYVAKAIHLLSLNDTVAYPPPYVFSWWVISDLYEETNGTGASVAFSGCYGLMTRGTPSIAQSWDVRKPVFNAFMLLHRLGAYKVSCTGGSTASPGVNAIGTISTKGDTVSVLVYSHVDGTTGNSSTTDNVTLNVTMPTGWTNARMEHFVVDVNHSNSYQTWVGLGKPSSPSAAQWTTIANAAQLAHYDSVATVNITGGTYTKTFTQNYYSVGLIQLTHPGTKVLPMGKAPDLVKLSAIVKGNGLYLSLPSDGTYSVQLYSASGRKVMDRRIMAKGTVIVSLADVTGGVYLMECSGPARKLYQTVVVGK
jgi:xylan 1,4-beta-xylosidase